MAIVSKAWVQSGARDLRCETIQMPLDVAPGEAIAKVEGSGICGSDYEQYLGNFDDTGVVTYPLVIGHEPVVRILEVGDDAAKRWDVKAGDRVAVEPHVGCGVCRYCTSGRQVLCPTKLQYGYMPLTVGSGLWGSLAEYMVLTGNTVLHKIPEEIAIEDALLFNPLAAGYEWAVNKGGVGIGDTVLILGAGQRGLACVVACQQAGAQRVIISGLERDHYKLELAKKLGASVVVVTDPENPRSLIDQVGAEQFDCVVDVVPAATQPFLDAIEAVRVGGTVVVGGIKGMKKIADFVSDRLVFKSITLKGALGVSSLGYQMAVRAVIAGDLDFAPWHSHTLSLEHADEAIRILGNEVATDTEPLHISVLPS